VGVLLLPAQPDDSIDFARLTSQLDIFNSVRSCTASTPTAPPRVPDSFRGRVFDQINELLAGCCAEAGWPFQLGAATRPLSSLDRVRRSSALAPSPIQVILPDWLPSTTVGRGLPDPGGCPRPVCSLVSTTTHAKDAVGPELLAGLARAVPELVGLKRPV